MLERILVPLDGSKLSEWALEPALALAQEAGGELILLSVPVLKRMFVTDSGGLAFLLPEDSLDDSKQELTKYLKTLATRHAHPAVKLSTVVVEGDEASAIVETAAAQNADLIVMSTHGHSGIQRWLLGSVTERVLQRSPCPVLAIRSGQPIARLLIPLDGSRLAETALAPGFEIAAKMGCATTLLSVIDHLDVRPADTARLETPAAAEHPTEGSLIAEYKTYLQDIGQKYPEAGRYNIHVAVAMGRVAQTILEYAADQRIDLIAMTTHGRTGLRRWLYGSVTEKVLRGAHCHVLVVRPPGPEAA
jgi:nucleotide-binding universal stress UspA family protein